MVWFELPLQQRKTRHSGFISQHHWAAWTHSWHKKPGHWTKVTLHWTKPVLPCQHITSRTWWALCAGHGTGALAQCSYEPGHGPTCNKGFMHPPDFLTPFCLPAHIFWEPIMCSAVSSFPLLLILSPPAAWHTMACGRDHLLGEMKGLLKQQDGADQEISVKIYRCDVILF